MPKTTPSSCPACNAGLIISELKCPDCQTVVKGEFFLSPLGNLSEEQVSFVRTFVLARGSIREVESRLGISYPTVRNKLDDVIAAIETSAPAKMGKQEVLDSLESGKITAAQAAEMLRDL